MNDKQTLLLVYLAGGSLLVILALPLLKERVRPNVFYGFRFPKSFRSPEIWYAVNKYGAKRLLWSGVSLNAAAVGLYFFPRLSLDAYALGCLAAFGVVFTLGLIQSMIYLRSL